MKSRSILLAAAAAVALTGAASAKDLNKIGISLGSMGNPFFVALATGATDKAKEINPNVEVTALGYDGVWFGVIMVKLVELAVLTPPVGMNLFAVIGASEGKVKLPEIYRGILPFIVIEAVVLALLIGFPELSLWLPRQMFN